VVSTDPAVIDVLVGRAQGGDRASFDAVVEALHAEVAAFAALRVADRDLADEVVQTTFVDAFLHLADYRLEGTFAAWLKGIARHRALRLLRERARAGDAIDAALADAALTYETAHTDADDEPWRLPRLRACLDRLAPEARRLVEARYVHEQPLDALVRESGRTYAALSNAMTRIRASLRACVERGQP
jgi:RNA polymerase sigma-70 factor (ECF subfamily)